MAELDPRIVKVTVDIDGLERTFETPLAITATGVKYANALQNQCEITIFNMRKALRDQLLTETSPYNLNKTPKRVTLEAGRESYGTSVIYVGNVVYCSVSQPPDIGITMHCLTGNFLKGNILSRTQPGTATIEQISKQLAQDNELLLDYQATDKNVSNFNYSGSSMQHVEALAALGGINVFVNDNTLYVKDAWVPLTGKVREVSANKGMVGIPEFTERGVRVTFLMDGNDDLGGSLVLESKLYPSANGTYVIYKLGFQVTSRDTPFYYIAEAARGPNQ